VIVEGEQLISHGQDPARLVDEARARGIRVPYIFFVEPSAENTVKLGL
jgi:tRNA A-37 threonylcarbamoyl transferase component Bud32